jgi:hypothetical protein
MSRFRVLLPVLLLVLAVPACIVSRKEMSEVTPASQDVESALRVFLADGSVIVFPEGAEVGVDQVRGYRTGARFDLARTPEGPQDAVPLDSVIGMEAFDNRTDPGLSILASVGVTALAVGATIGLVCAADPKCFGSCPTVYSYDDQGEVLEAETFSYSISPLLEGRDVDRLSVAADPDGSVTLEVRNEALETHYINHLELLEVRHGPEERVLPDPGNEALVVGSLRPVGVVRDRDGRDVTATVAVRDGDPFASSDVRLAAVTQTDDRDWLELTLPAAPADSVALVLRLRNSLLNTVLFYDFMLSRQGATALDWMARDVERIGTAVELGRWFRETMGLRLEVEGPGGYAEVARMGDTGPIAWKEMAFVVPVQPGEPTRLRLSFLTDEWRIDHMTWSPQMARPRLTVHAPAALEPLTIAAVDDGLARVSAPDEEYLVTTAGAAFEVRFETGAVAEDVRRTFLLSSQGYYSEWVRPMWVRAGADPTPFEPTDALLPELMARWMEVKGPMEDAFHDTRIPVR